MEFLGGRYTILGIAVRMEERGACAVVFLAGKVI